MRNSTREIDKWREENLITMYRLRQSVPSQTVYSRNKDMEIPDIFFCLPPCLDNYKVSNERSCLPVKPTTGH